MQISTLYCTTKYYSEYDSTAVLIRLQEEFSIPIRDISHEMLMPLYKLCFDAPHSYWNRNVAREVLQQLENLYLQNPSDIKIDEASFEYFLMGYNAYMQISETLSDMRDFNIAQEIKTRMYRLPAYTSIVEGALSNLLRVIASIVSSVTGKDYVTQSKLANLLEMANKNGFSEISARTNVNLRNAINHGKVSIRKEQAHEKIRFYYMENRKACSSEMPIYEFDNEIDSVYDMVSGVLLALSIFFNNHIEIIQLNRKEKTYIAFALFALELSLPGVQCISINDTGNDKQLNIELKVDNTERGYLLQLSVMIAILGYSRYDDYQKYMINFSSARMQGSWVRYTKDEVASMYESPSTITTCVQNAIDRNDSIIFPTSTEPVDLNEIKYFVFPNHITDRYKISCIEDGSLPDRKRLRAHLFVGEISTRETLLEIIDEAIEWLKGVKNPPSPTLPHKHGDMPADALYVNVYKEDARKNKDMLLNNENFICFVDYNASGKTTLDHGGVPVGIWNRYLHESIGLKQIAWRDATYFTRHVVKIGRNDLCPCGSGKKYKHCCGQ